MYIDVIALIFSNAVITSIYIVWLPKPRWSLLGRHLYTTSVSHRYRISGIRKRKGQQEPLSTLIPYIGHKARLVREGGIFDIAYRGEREGEGGRDGEREHPHCRCRERFHILRWRYLLVM
jgi:hypothetical protein